MTSGTHITIAMSTQRDNKLRTHNSVGLTSVPKFSLFD